jgi:uncharacterized protein (TIGR02996 family)
VSLVFMATRRHDGQSITGNAQSATARPGTGSGAGQNPAEAAATTDPARRAALEHQVKEHPDDAAAHLVFARYLLEVGEPTEAVKEYVATARLDPKNAEANAYAGWVSFLAAQSANADPKTAAELTDRALTRLDAAIAASPDYPDADFERYLALVPDGALNDQVKQLLDQARQQSG